MTSSNALTAAPDVVVLSVSADHDLIRRLDDWIAGHVEPMTREEAARALLASALSGNKTGKRRRPVSGPVDAPMVRAARKMKAAAARAEVLADGKP